jgi:membrane protease YdiL (CAAX protease family)
MKHATAVGIPKGRALALASSLLLSLLWAATFVVALEQDRLYPLLGTVAVVVTVLSLLVAPSLRRQLLRPRAVDVALGAGFGIVLVLATQVGFTRMSPHLPGLGADVAVLYGVAAVTPARLAVVVVIAVAEELLWRGVLLDALQQRIGPAWRVAGVDAAAVVGAAVVYGAAQAGPRSVWLVLAGVGLGTVWGLMRVRSRGLWMPIAAHLVWTLTILGAWPLQP